MYSGAVLENSVKFYSLRQQMFAEIGRIVCFSYVCWNQESTFNVKFSIWLPRLEAKGNTVCGALHCLQLLEKSDSFSLAHIYDLRLQQRHMQNVFSHYHHYHQSHRWWWLLHCHQHLMASNVISQRSINSSTTLGDAFHYLILSLCQLVVFLFFFSLILVFMQVLA